MPTPKLTIPNIAEITKRDPHLGEVLQKVHDYINANTTPAAGNLQAPPSFVNPTKAPG